MQFIIRPAQKEDFDAVPELMLQAMEEIVFNYMQKQDIEEAIYFLTKLFKQPANLYSYENTFVAVNDDNDIIGSITGYNGADYARFQQPVLELMKREYNNFSTPEEETNDSEFYLDTVAVSPMAQGKGVGSKLLKYAVEHAQKQNLKQAGLLVDLNNPDAQKLYERLGFKPSKKITFAGGEYYHMQLVF